MTKRSIVIVTSVFIVLGISFLLINRFVHTINSQRSCEWANIDNVELHIGMDIPEVLDCKCKYDKEQNSKRIRFDLHKNIDIKTYLLAYNFEKLNVDKDTVLLSGFSYLDKSELKTSVNNNYYHKEGINKGSAWKVLLNSKDFVLWITINYKD